MKQKKKEKQFVWVRILVQQDFMFPKCISKKRIVNEFFKDFPLWRSHATRDTCKIGNSDKLKKIVFVKEI